MTELAVVVAIVGILLSSLMYTFSAQVDQRDFEETRRRLDQARELVIAFSVVNGRLPCPARGAATSSPATVAGDEVRDATGQCLADGVEDYYGGSNGGVTLGLLPAKAIGYQQVDAAGFAIDAWGQRIRYAVAKTITNCSGSSTTPHFTNATNLKTNGISCQPNDLLVCKSVTGANPPSCGGGGANQIMSAGLVVAVIFSTGKNQSGIGGAGADEAANLKTATSGLSPAINPLFVYHTPTPSTATNGEFDDQLTWITHGELYGKLISAGVLP